MPYKRAEIETELFSSESRAEDADTGFDGKTGAQAAPGFTIKVRLRNSGSAGGYVLSG